VTPRKRFEWKLRDRTLNLGDRTLILGVLNLTPDSFSDGGNYQDPDRAFARAIELEELGASVIDIGAESTRPGATRISDHAHLRGRRAPPPGPRPQASEGQADHPHLGRYLQSQRRRKGV
jgi:hypothetical protein